MTAIVPVFDGHNDTILRLELAHRQGLQLDFAGGAPKLHIDLPRAQQSGFAGGLFAMFAPSRVLGFDEEYDVEDPSNFAAVHQSTALTFTMALFARMRRLAHELPDQVSICGNSTEVRAAMAANRIAMVPHIEGAECIDAEFHALEVLHAAGLRSLGLVWSRPNIFGHGAPMARQPQLEPGKGLTDLGRELVRECERCGILVDLSHLSEAGFWDVAEIAHRPLVASHSNVHAISPSARNLTDRQLSAIRESGGLVGLNFHVGFLREDCRLQQDTPIAEMIRHLDHMLQLLGEDGVALGSDFDGCFLPQEIADVTGLPKLLTAMRQTGYGDQLIEKICHGNWLRALDAAGGAP